MRLLPLPGVFAPHSDSWMLARALAHEPLEGGDVLDLCTGSGLLAVVAAMHGAREAVAVDVSRRAVTAARLNARLNGVRVSALRGDLFQPLMGRRFDFIVSNPPYVPGPAEELPRRGLARAWEAGPHGRAFLDRICDGVYEHLNPGGVLLLVHSSASGEPQTLDTLKSHGLPASVIARARGPLGPRLAERSRWLREQGLLHGDEEEMLLIRASRAPSPSHAPVGELVA